MPKPRLLADEHVPQSVVARLNSYGIDTLHVDEADLKDEPDRQIYNFAEKESRVILTMDSDFQELVENSDGPGLLYFTRRVRNQEMAAEIVKVFNNMTVSQLSGEVIYLPWD